MYENRVGEGVFLWPFSALFWGLWIKKNACTKQAFRGL
jgi:hypothetical protein